MTDEQSFIYYITLKSIINITARVKNSSVRPAPKSLHFRIIKVEV